MPSISVIGNNPGSLELNLPTAKTHVLYEVVNWQLAKRRRGTASTQTRAEVSRTGKKLYSQKGTGNARHGDRSAPIYVGGGAAFGPKPRDYSYTLPKKVRKLGLAMAVSSRVSEGKVLAVDGFNLDGKTKGFLAWAKANGMDGSERVFLVTNDEMAIRAAKNLHWVTAVKAAGLNCYDVLRHEQLVADKAVLEAVGTSLNFKADAAEKNQARATALKASNDTDAANAHPMPIAAARASKGPKGVVAKAALAAEGKAVVAPKVKVAKVKAEVETLKAAPETAQVEEVAPKATKKAIAGDDLKRIEGIGPKINDALLAAGISTFAELAGSSEESLKTALESADMRSHPSIGTWAEQAALLANGDEAGFVALTEKLVAGRKEEGDA
jgi:large subunit ribosomal protein L4